jgi:uncharacterized protein
MSRIAFAVFLLLSPVLFGQGKEYILANYTKYEFKIPMRDGVRLFTAVYVPKDDSKPYPFMMTRTPYSVGPYGVDLYKDNLGLSPLMGKEGYIFVYQDVRGRWMSEGEFVNMRPHKPTKTGKEIDESTDTYDTIDWLVKNVPNNNGKCGLGGISYPGFYSAAGMIDAHPALKAVSPQAPVTDWFVGDDFHHNGAFFLPHAFNFMANFGKPRPEPTTKFNYLRFEHDSTDAYDFFLKMGPLANADYKYFKGEIAFWKEIMAHGSYDEFWQSRNIRAHLKEIKPAVLTVGGWQDAENLFGALEVYRNVEAMSPKNPQNLLVMGPWVHGGWSRGDGDSLGPVKFNAKTTPHYQQHIELPFFEHHLKGKTPYQPAKAMIFETGTNRWRKFDAWPPKEAKPVKFYFQAEETLGDAPLTDAKNEFVSDPAKPVPYIFKHDIGMMKEYMVADQRFAAARPDVLTYQTPPLETDRTFAGAMDVELHVATTGTDADWCVKLIDVYPNTFPDPDPNPTGVKLGGYQQLVRGELFRGKFRTGFDKPTPFVAGEPAVVKFRLPDIAHTFRPGHRIMIQVQSSWFPLVDRNPQKFCDIYTAKESDFQKATHTLFHGKGKPSSVTLLEISPLGK